MGCDRLPDRNLKNAPSVNRPAAGYAQLRQRLENIAQRHGSAQFLIRLDAALQRCPASNTSEQVGDKTLIVDSEFDPGHYVATIVHDKEYGLFFSSRDNCRRVPWREDHRRQTSHRQRTRRSDCRCLQRLGRRCNSNPCQTGRHRAKNCRNAVAPPFGSPIMAVPLSVNPCCSGFHSTMQENADGSMTL